MLVNPNQYLADTFIGIYWLIIDLYSLIIIKKGRYFPFDFGWYSIHFDIVR